MSPEPHGGKNDEVQGGTDEEDDGQRMRKSVFVSPTTGRNDRGKFLGVT